jgi:hypothetical protein
VGEVVYISTLKKKISFCMKTNRYRPNRRRNKCILMLDWKCKLLFAERERDEGNLHFCKKILALVVFRKSLRASEASHCMPHQNSELPYPFSGHTN